MFDVIFFVIRIHTFGRSFACRYSFNFNSIIPKYCIWKCVRLFGSGAFVLIRTIFKLMNFLPATHASHTRRLDGTCVRFFFVRSHRKIIISESNRVHLCAWHRNAISSSDAYRIEKFSCTLFTINLFIKFITKIIKICVRVRVCARADVSGVCLLRMRLEFIPSSIFEKTKSQSSSSANNNNNHTTKNSLLSTVVSRPLGRHTE